MVTDITEALLTVGRVTALRLRDVGVCKAEKRATGFQDKLHTRVERKRNPGEPALPEGHGAVVSGVRKDAGFPREGYGHVIVHSYTGFTGQICRKGRTVD